MPARITRVIDEINAYAERNDKEFKIDTSLLGKLKAGDWVLTNANLAVSKISLSEAKTINNYFKNNVI